MQAQIFFYPSGPSDLYYWPAHERQHGVPFCHKFVKNIQPDLVVITGMGVPHTEKMFPNS